MRKIRADLFQYSDNYPWVSPSNHICTVDIPKKQDRRKLAETLLKGGFKVKLVSITHNDRWLTFNYFVFDMR